MTTNFDLTPEEIAIVLQQRDLNRKIADQKTKREEAEAEFLKRKPDQLMVIEEALAILYEAGIDIEELEGYSYYDKKTGKIIR